MAPLNMMIVGAGVGGLAVATGLARNGHRVTVYERLTSGSDVGYAFRITANSDRCLKHLDIDTVAGGAVAANSSRMFNAQGQVLMTLLENDDAEKAKRATSVFAYRPQLQTQLMQVALESGVKVNSGVKVESVDVAKTEISLADGAIISADLIIAADGLHSVVRPYVVESTKFSAKSTIGQSAVRFMLPKALARSDSIMSAAMSDDVHMYAWKGNEKRILMYPVDYDTKFNITGTFPSKLLNQQASNDSSATVVAYNQKISYDAVLEIFDDFDPIAKRLFTLADPDGFRVWQLKDMDDHPHWTLNHTTLLGDACHAVLPFAFSGASMAIEDGITLSTLISPDLPVEDIPGRLKLYEQIRRPRIDRVREASLDIAKGLETPDYVRDFMQFLCSHDAVEHAKQELSRYLETGLGTDGQRV